MIARIYILLSMMLLPHIGKSSITIFDEIVPVHNKKVRDKVLETLDKMKRLGITPQRLLSTSEYLFPYFEYEMNRYGVHSDFKYLAVVESNLKNEARSYVGAAGLWQIMPNTGRELGLIVNQSYDERFHIKLSTKAAMTYLSRNYKVLKNWTLTAASYNCGLGCIQKGIYKAGEKDFYELKLNTETTDYIYKIIAVKFIFETYLSKAKSFNYDISKIDSNISKHYIDTLNRIPSKKDSTLKFTISKSVKDDILTIKPVELKYLGEVEFKNDIEQKLNENIRLKFIKGKESHGFTNSYYEFIADYNKSEERAYFTLNGSSLGLDKIEQIIKVYDEDGNPGLAIPDFNGKLYRNLKLKAKIFQYE